MLIIAVACLAAFFVGWLAGDITCAHRNRVGPWRDILSERQFHAFTYAMGPNNLPPLCMIHDCGCSGEAHR